ncbi:MAG: GTP-binding protein [Rhodospirillales bacterium]
MSRQVHAQPEGAPSPIPLTVIGGFLGSGKTSLVNHILTRSEGRRIAVLVNDFGALNIDAKLIVAVEGETVSLANGCICCSIRDDLLSEVLRLCARQPAPERIVIETSGVSQPIAVAETFLTPAAQGLIELQALIALLDADLMLDPQAGYGDLAFDQVKTSDLLVVNKCDLVPPERLAGLKARIREILPHARLWETTFGQVPLDLVFTPAEGERQRQTGGAAPAHPAFESWVYRDSDAWSFSALQRAVERLPTEIYRAKGLVRLDLPNGDQGEFQMTGRRSWLRLVAGQADQPTELLFIGQPGATDEDALARLFAEAREAHRQQGDEGYLVGDLRSFSVIFG